MFWNKKKSEPVKLERKGYAVKLEFSFVNENLETKDLTHEFLWKEGTDGSRDFCERTAKACANHFILEPKSPFLVSKEDGTPTELYSISIPSIANWTLCGQYIYIVEKVLND